VELPEDRLEDAEYQAAIRVVARLPENPETSLGGDAPVLVVLPAGARLIRVDPPQVRVTRLPPPPDPFLPAEADAEETPADRGSAPDPAGGDDPPGPPQL
jgi:hypothetical protein